MKNRTQSLRSQTVSRSRPPRRRRAPHGWSSPRRSQSWRRRARPPPPWRSTMTTSLATSRGTPI